MFLVLNNRKIILLDGQSWKRVLNYFFIKQYTELMDLLLNDSEYRT